MTTLPSARAEEPSTEASESEWWRHMNAVLGKLTATIEGLETRVRPPDSHNHSCWLPHN